MTKVVNVRFRDAGKPYRFSCNDLTLSIGDAVMVETNLGLDLAHVCVEPYEMEITKDSEETKLLPVIRLATEEEIVQYEKKCRDEEEAYTECIKLIEKHGLEMNLIDVVYALLHCRRQGRFQGARKGSGFPVPYQDRAQADRIP